MEQLITFIIIVLISVTTLMLNSPLLFLLSFIGGVSYHVIRGRKKGWSLPKEVKNTHSW
jgi:hypothetical protein